MNCLSALLGLFISVQKTDIWRRVAVNMRQYARVKGSAVPRRVGPLMLPRNLLAEWSKPSRDLLPLHVIILMRPSPTFAR